MDARQAAGLPVYVIMDSHHNGPGYRPFAGWYVNAFSHARRVINPPADWPAYNEQVASFKGSTCFSRMTLRGSRR
jgi:hypothetical protein